MGCTPFVPSESSLTKDPGRKRHHSYNYPSHLKEQLCQNLPSRSCLLALWSLSFSAEYCFSIHAEGMDYMDFRTLHNPAIQMYHVLILSEGPTIEPSLLKLLFLSRARFGRQPQWSKRDCRSRISSQKRSWLVRSSLSAYNSLSGAGTYKEVPNRRLPLISLIRFLRFAEERKRENSIPTILIPEVLSPGGNTDCGMWDETRARIWEGSVVSVGHPGDMAQCTGQFNSHGSVNHLIQDRGPPVWIMEQELSVI